MNTNQKAARELPDSFYFIICIIAFMFTGFNLYKMQPILPTLMDFLGINEGRIGLLLSVCSFVSLCLSLPFGALVSRKGQRLTMAAGMVCEIAGCVLGWFRVNYGIILISQLLLGLANTIFMVCCPSLLQMVYDEKRFAVNVGILNAAQNIGMAIAFAVVPAISAAWGIPSIWAFLIPATLLVLLCWVGLFTPQKETGLKERAVRRNAAGAAERRSEAERNTSGTGTPPLKDQRFWLLSVGSFLLMFSCGAILNFSASFLSTVRGLSESQASNISLGFTFTGIIACAGAGWVGNRFGKKRTYIGIVFLLALLRYLLVAAPTGIPMVIVIAMQGFPAAAVVIVNSIVPVLCRSVDHQPVAVAMISTAVTAGLCLSSFLGGAIISAVGYNTTFLLLIPVSLAALVGALPIPNE